MGIIFPLVANTFLAIVDGDWRFFASFDGWLAFIGQGFVAGIPFAILLSRGMNNLTPWIVAVAPTAGFWTYYVRSILAYTGGGADLFIGFVMLCSPLIATLELSRPIGS